MDTGARGYAGVDAGVRGCAGAIRYAGADRIMTMVFRMTMVTNDAGVTEGTKNQRKMY